MYNFRKIGVFLKKIIEEIVVTLFREAFFFSLRDKDIASENSFKSLGLSYDDISCFIYDFIIKENVVFYTLDRDVFIGDSIGDMVDFIEDSFLSTGGSELSGKISFRLHLHDIQTKKRGVHRLAL